MKKFVTDFETNNNPENCFVWAYGICEIGNEDNWHVDNSIDSLFNYWESLNDNVIAYFHNLAFDGEFIVHHLFQNGYKFVEKCREKKTFSTLITRTGIWYTMQIMLSNGKKIKLFDSFKIIPMKVEKIPKAYGLEESKGIIDYNKERSFPYTPTQEEIEYIYHDVHIVSKALHFTFKQGLNRMTQGSNALHMFKSMITKKKFDMYFPILDCDHKIRPSYKGGWTYLNKKYKGRYVTGGKVYDVNSLYPSIMYDRCLPIGQAIPFEGRYKPNKIYPLSIQKIYCTFRLKEGYLPTIQMKNTPHYQGNVYLESSVDENGYDSGVELTLTGVDIDLFFEHYEVTVLEWSGGFMFMGKTGIFKEYIDYWTEIKIKSKETGNKGMETIAKNMLNTLYGKFGTNPININKLLEYDYDARKIIYVDSEEDWKDPVYIPMASYITAYCREYTIRSAQKNYDRFIYADTDSMHLEGYEDAKGIEVHPTRLGAWDNEFIFSRGKFLRQKCYLEFGYNPSEISKLSSSHIIVAEKKVTCAGMPDSCHQYVTFENFNIGKKYIGKNIRKRVPNGVSITQGEFTIKSG